MIGPFSRGARLPTHPGIDARALSPDYRPTLPTLDPTTPSAHAPDPGSGIAVAYLSSLYPAVSHTFILREVRGLRGLGARVESISVRPARASDLLSQVDREEAASTATILPATPRELLTAHAETFLRAPVRYVRTLRDAMAMARPGWRNAAWQLFYFAEAGILARLCRRRGVRHVHAHFANVGADVALLASRLGGRDRTWSFTMHGPTEFSEVDAHKLAEKTADAAFVACISDYCRSQLMRLLPPERWDKLSIVHCGIDPDRFEWVDRTDRDGPLRVLAVGRLVPEKGQALLVEAVARLARQGVAVELDLVGDGQDRAALERSAARLGVADRVTFAGAVGQDEIRRHYRDADVFCLPSFAEGVPVVLMEAMASGLPVVTTAVMGIPELVEDGVSGRLLRPGRADLIVDALSELADDPAARREMGRAGRARVLDEFTVAGNAARLADLFAALPAARERR